MYSYIKYFTYLNDYSIHLTFENGKEGVVDLSSYTERSGVFSKFSDIDYFRKVYIDHVVLTWPNNVDIAPETIYSLATGESLPEWVGK